MDFLKLISEARIYASFKGNLVLAEECDKALKILEEQEKILIVNKEEAHHLMNYFMHVGYISPDEHEPVHKFIERLKEFLK